jgi:hypothetical protein
MMAVTPFERARFLVESESSPEQWYLVDMLEHTRQGRCECPHFSITIEPLYEAGESPVKRSCKHIKRVVKFIAKLVQSLVSFRLNKSERDYAVKKFLFQLAALEARCKINPQRYGATA